MGRERRSGGEGRKGQVSEGERALIVSHRSFRVEKKKERGKEKLWWSPRLRIRWRSTRGRGGRKESAVKYGGSLTSLLSAQRSINAVPSILAFSPPTVSRSKSQSTARVLMPTLQKTCWWPLIIFSCFYTLSFPSSRPVPSRRSLDAFQTYLICSRSVSARSCVSRHKRGTSVVHVRWMCCAGVVCCVSVRSIPLKFIHLRLYQICSLSPHPAFFWVVFWVELAGGLGGQLRVSYENIPPQTRADERRKTTRFGLCRCVGGFLFFFLLFLYRT